ncbi:MAG: general secretion pathway protein GspK [Verrucomicrobia bacterium]|nr:general secretion pathway protein GspK [Verrucomicrobiota bacterium]
MENPASSIGNRQSTIDNSKRGAALIVVMWVLLIVSLIVSTFAFEMQLESRLISAQRKRFKADQLALAGVELAKAMLAFEEDPLEGDDVVYDDPYLAQAAKIADGIPVSFSEKLGDGTVTVRIDYEKGRQNIHTIEVETWKDLFEQAGIPLVDWDPLIDCLKDWEDENDLHWANGAESDDWFYREKGYPCKNAPVDTVDELLLIKEWTQEVLYGTPPEMLEQADNPMTGIAQYLTTWGDGKINPNSASREVLISTGLSEGIVGDILDARLGPDGEDGTDDDGMTREDFDALGLGNDLFTLKPEYVAITSEGSVGEVVSTISSVFKLGGKEPSPLFWLEGEENKKKEPASEF